MRTNGQRGGKFVEHGILKVQEKRTESINIADAENEAWKLTTGFSNMEVSEDLFKNNFVGEVEA